MLHVLVALAVAAHCTPAVFAAKSKTPTPILCVESVTANSVSLFWTDIAANEIDWTLERATMSTGPFSVVGRLAPNTTNFTDVTVSPGTTYYYRAGYLPSKGTRKSSAVIKVKTLAADVTPPTVPAGVVATAAACTRIDVSWTASTDASSGLRGYRVFRNGVFVQEVLVPAVSWSDTNVAGATTAAYSVNAFDNAGNVSSSSDPVSATTPSCGGPPTGRFVSVTLLGATDSDYGMAVAVDRNGNFGVGGSVGGKAYFAKLSPGRQILWSVGLTTAGSVQSVAFDPAGDVVISGYFFATADFGGSSVTSAGGYDIFVAKYSSGGILRWVNRYGSAQAADFAGDEAGHSVAVDSAGNIAVAGSYLETVDFGNGLHASRGGKDGFVMKLDPNGGTLWSKTFGNTGTDDAATTAQFDAADNLFIGGRFSVSVDLGGGVLTAAGSYDACIAKYAPTGEHLWSRRAGGSGFDTVRALCVAPGDSVLVTGDYRLSANFDGVAFTGNGEEDVFLVKYSGANGLQVWAKSFGSWNTDSGNSVRADADGNVIIAGRLGAAMDFGGGAVSTRRNGYNIYVAKFTPSGAHLWSKALGNGREDARGLAIDSRNYPFVTGRCALTNDFGGGVFSNYGTNLNPDIFVLELEP